MVRIALALVLLAGCAGEQQETKRTPARAQTQNDGPGPTGGVSPEQADAIDAAFRRKTSELMTCWQDEYEKTHNRQLQGDVTVGLTVTPSGKPTDVRVLKSSLGNADIEQCVVNTINQWEFPQVPANCPYMRTVHLGAEF